MCAECHEADSDYFASAHLGIDAASIDCLGCHDPHASEDPVFLKPVVHNPFSERTCDKCHEVEGP
jgi:hypothetical protein